jgi:hypothetical protein
VRVFKLANFVPSATVAVSVGWFRELGIEFFPGQDDFDNYEFAGVPVSGLSYGLLHYQNPPVEETTLPIPEGAVFEQYLHTFAREFRLPLTSFKWR